jgi:hypothetical protein
MAWVGNYSSGRQRNFDRVVLLSSERIIGDGSMTS